MILWLVDKKALMMQFIVCKTEKATSLKNISSMQDTGVVTYNRLNFVVVFKVHLGGLSKQQAQVQVLLQVNKRLLIVCRITTAP